MSGSGTLTIETNDLEDGPFAMLTLRHDGAGMNRDDAERVFDPPFLSKDRGRGTGLGLAPVLGMIEQSGGTIRAKGHQGPGIVFEICLPRAQPERDSSDPHRAQASVETRAAEAATVLLVEDDDAVRRVVAETLRRQGYSVVDFPRGADAVSFCEYYAGPIDLLLTDVVMPEMSGPELGKRALELRPTLRVLYMSGYTDVGIVRDGVLDEGVSFLQKPVTREALLQAVQATLATLAPGRTSA
jgi:CheY-like chemotaxis protein